MSSTYADQQHPGVLGHRHRSENAGHHDDGAQQDAESGGQVLTVIHSQHPLLLREAIQQPGAVPDEQAAT